MIKERVVFYFGQRKKLPEHILFYRDGVSESQYGMIYLEELPLIRDGCKEALTHPSVHLPADTPLPKITLLVVGKRHHIRFLPDKKPDKYVVGDKKLDRSLPAGLIIDHTVVNAHQFSFYLQSHESPQGTARPGHYVVIVNESKYSVGKLQEIVSGTKS
jgi:eukaryotic translation initiation factor 2C